MKLSSFAPAALLLALGSTHPVSLDILRRTENIDVTILQFALTLEHLENVFYKSALTLFSEDDFKKAGFGKHFFENLQFVVEDEQSHVQLLTGAIQAAGQAPVAPCTYSFPFNDVNSFVTLSSVLEGVGTSAIAKVSDLGTVAPDISDPHTFFPDPRTNPELGAASLITDKSILSTAGSILVTESIHQSQQRDALYEVPAANALGTPISANAIFTLAASFIVECPASNVALPFTAFPALKVDDSGCGDEKGGKWNKWRNYKRTDGDKKKDDEMKDDNKYDNYDKWDQQYNQWKKDLVCPAPKVGEGAKFHSDCEIPQGSFLTFVSGLTTISVRATISGTVAEAAVPAAISGQSYVFVTKTAMTGMIMDGDVISGPAVLEVTPSPPVIDNTTF